MKRLMGLALSILFALSGQGQVYYNPNVAIKPIAGLSVYKVELTDTTTTVVIRIINEKQLPPFFLRTNKIKIRKVSDQKNLMMIRSSNVPFYPEKHNFSFQNEIFEFTLVFPALEKPVKYFDIIEDTPQKEFYIQGVIIDPELNRSISKGFLAYERGDREGALEAFINAAEMDLYFEYSMIYFNIIYILAEMNRWQEAKDWYKKFKNHFFFDKALMESEFNRLGIMSRLQ